MSVSAPGASLHLCFWEEGGPQGGVGEDQVRRYRWGGLATSPPCLDFLTLEAWWCGRLPHGQGSRSSRTACCRERQRRRWVRGAVAPRAPGAGTGAPRGTLEVGAKSERSWLSGMRTRPWGLEPLSSSITRVWPSIDPQGSELLATGFWKASCSAFLDSFSKCVSRTLVH